MKTIKLAVFGHYDSRGGTTGMPLEAFTIEEVKRACADYNKVFEWEQMLTEYRANPETWGWDPTQPGSSPGDNDFLYVAELHYPDDAPMEGDLEELGVVIKDDSTETGYVEGTPIEVQAEGSLQSITQLEFIPLGKSRYEAQDDEDDDVFEARMREMAQVVRGPEVSVPHWNDDAFGFIIGTGL